MNKYGARIVVIVGSVIAGLSFFASIVCSNIYMFMIFYGFLGGNSVFLFSTLYSSNQINASTIHSLNEMVALVSATSDCTFNNRFTRWLVSIVLFLRRLPGKQTGNSQSS